MKLCAMRALKSAYHRSASHSQAFLDAIANMKTFPVKKSLLEERALSEKLSSDYPIRNPVKCVLHRITMSDVYQIGTPDEDFFLKIYRKSDKSEENIRDEVRLVNDLIDKEVPIPKPVHRNDGGYLTRIHAPEGERIAILFHAALGQEPQEANKAHSHRFGRLIGKLHSCADELNHEYKLKKIDENYLILDPVRYMKQYLEHREDDYNYLLQFGKDLAEELASKLDDSAPVYGICHGDVHTGNARMDDSGNISIFDFDSSGYGWRVIDIGTYAVSYDWKDLTKEGKRKKESIWNHFLEGYNEWRPLTENELSVLHLSMPIRQLELTGIGMQKDAKYEGTHWITDEFFDSLIKWLRDWLNKYSKY